MSASTLGDRPYSRSITRIVLANTSQVFSGTLNVTSRIGFFDFLAGFGFFVGGIPHHLSTAPAPPAEQLFGITAAVGIESTGFAFSACRFRTL